MPPSGGELSRYDRDGSSKQMQAMTIEHPVQINVKKGNTEFWYQGPDGSKATSNAFKLAKKMMKNDF